MNSEFDLIRRFFTRPAPQAVLGVGDDAALMEVAPGMELAVSTDMLVAGTHFFPDADPEKLGWKTLAVNLSDMAAMGARPRWATLAMALPCADEAWLTAFATGFFACADKFGVDLIGGDTTRGPLNLSVTIFGEVERGKALRRDGAKPGDDIWVSGRMGCAALALNALQGEMMLDEKTLAACRNALDSPQPQVILGLGLRSLATSAIDISDGLLADLGHILERSHVGAEIHFDALPTHPVVKLALADDLVRQCVLAGGDDYELCFTAPVLQREKIKALACDCDGLDLTRIGQITAESGLRVLDASGQPMPIAKGGYDHFA
ncbi:MAG: thiamine-phosphate kinase [Methylobacillus sp.]|jgi:thiamine-monophosphate kinase|nr:thiamine-phosphate kinase [Methylobacillus sp.]